MLPISSTFIGKTKTTSPWTSKTPRHYKHSTINVDFHDSKKFFKKVDYPLHFINSVINKFQKCKKCGYESFIIPSLKLQNLSYTLKYPTVNSMN